MSVYDPNSRGADDDDDDDDRLKSMRKNRTSIWEFNRIQRHIQMNVEIEKVKQLNRTHKGKMVYLALNGKCGPHLGRTCEKWH